MYILKNALKNLGRNKGRNILLGIIVFALILSTTVALVINSTTRGIIDDYKTRFGSKVTIGVDFDKLMEDAQSDPNGTIRYPSLPKITTKQYLNFADSEYLRSYKMVLSNLIGLEEGLVPVDDNEAGSFFVGETGNRIDAKAKLIGCLDTKDMPGFEEGLRKIIDGELFREINECIISSEFASVNGLQVGDEFSTIDGVNGNEIPLKVVGIYADATIATKDAASGVIMMSGPYDNRRNEIFVNMDTMFEHFTIHNADSVMNIDAEYELKSPDLLDEFETELREKGLPGAYDVSTDEEGYHRIIAPVEGLSRISMTFMLVVLIVGGVILLFVTTMAIRERKYEIGVLRAMGMKKIKVAIMFVAETVIITAICLGIGLGIGTLLSQPMADALLAYQVETVDSGTGISNNETDGLTEVDVSLTLEATAEITAVALALALLSSVAGVAYISRYEPMKILSERN